MSGVYSDKRVDRKISPLKYAFYTKLLLKVLLYRKKHYINELVKHIKHHGYTYITFKHPVFKIVSIVFRIEYRTSEDFQISILLSLYDLPKYMKTFFDKFRIDDRVYNSAHVSWAIFVSPSRYRLNIIDYDLFDRDDGRINSYKSLVIKNTQGPHDRTLPEFIFDVVKSWDKELSERHLWFYRYTAMSRRHMTVLSKLK